MRANADGAPAVRRGRERAGDLIALVKFRYHVTFVNVVFGALMFSPAAGLTVLVQLAVAYLSFNLLMYGGIYTMNDLADRLSDARHPAKRHRPIAAGRISVSSGRVFAAAMIGGGLTVALAAFEPVVVACHLAALALNVLYSFGGRNIRYVDLALNSAPHVVRFLMGVLLTGRVPPAGHLLGIFLLGVALSCLRRHVEKGSVGWHARATLLRYGRHEMVFIAAGSVLGLVVVAGFAAATAPGYWGILLVSALVLVGGTFTSPVRSVFAALWLR